MVDSKDLDKIIICFDPDGNNYQYIIRPIDDVPDEVNKETISITPPGQSAENNTQLAVNGEENNITINFFVWNDGYDRANGTAPQDGTFSDTDDDGTDDVITVNEQIRYLKNYIESPQVVANWVITDTNNIYGDPSDPTTGTNVTLNRLRLPTYSRNTPKWRAVTMELDVGGSP